MKKRVRRGKRTPSQPSLAVLSRKKSLYSTRRLLEAATKQGFRTRVIDVLRCNLLLEAGRPRLFYKGQEVRALSVALPRIGASVTAAGLSVVRQLEALGVPLVNGSSAIARSRDKLNALQQLAAAGVRIPRTVLARGGGDVKELVAQVGGLPAILKLIQGTQGVGVMIAHSEAEVTSILGTLWDLGQEILLQEFIAESKGRDLRALVVGERVVGAMRREAKRGEFRSNLHRGGAGTAVALPPEYAEAAVRAAQVLGLDVAGVDLLESKAGPTVLELNSSPGFEGLEKATGLDIASEIVACAKRKAEGARRAMGL
jgi:ribosomal protein S6--L-glutamate ligase